MSTFSIFSTLVSIIYSQPFWKKFFKSNLFSWLRDKFTSDLSFTSLCKCAQTKEKMEKYLNQTREKYLDFCASCWFYLSVYFQCEGHLGSWMEHSMIKSRKSWCSFDTKSIVWHPVSCSCRRVNVYSVVDTGFKFGGHNMSTGLWLFHSAVPLKCTVFCTSKNLSSPNLLDILFPLTLKLHSFWDCLFMTQRKVDVKDNNSIATNKSLAKLQSPDWHSNNFYSIKECIIKNFIIILLKKYDVKLHFSRWQYVHQRSVLVCFTSYKKKNDSLSNQKLSH